MVSERLLKNVTNCVIRKDVLGSDHCPLVLGLNISDQNPSPSEQKTEGTTQNEGADP